MGYMNAHATTAYAVQQAFPNAPAWVGKATLVTGVLAAIAEGFALKQAKRERTTPSEYQDLAEYYRGKAKELEAEKAPVVAKSAMTSPNSIYLMEEGNTDINTDCFSCASGHLAAIDGSLTQAAKTARESGACDDTCIQELHLAIEESAALFANDWTEEKMAMWPEEQRDVVKKYSPLLQGVVGSILQGEASEQRLNLVEASAELAETVRFARSGDSLDHPEVDLRIRNAEAKLATAERLNPYAFADGVAENLRHLRQDVGSKLSSPEDLRGAVKRARQVSLEANKPHFGQIAPQDIEGLAGRMRTLREEFKADRRKAVSVNDS